MKKLEVVEREKLPEIHDAALNAACRANQKARQILADAPDCLIDQALDRELKNYIEKECRNIGVNRQGASSS